MLLLCSMLVDVVRCVIASVVMDSLCPIFFPLLLYPSTLCRLSRSLWLDMLSLLLCLAKVYLIWIVCDSFLRVLIARICVMSLLWLIICSVLLYLRVVCILYAMDLLELHGSRLVRNWRWLQSREFVRTYCMCLR